MTTTAIFAELLVSGFETLAWVVLLIFVVSGRRIDASTLVPYKDWSAAITILMVAACYALGTVSDRLADAVFGSWDKRLRRKWFKNDDQVGFSRLSVARSSEPLAKYLEYIRSRLRVARATSFNSICFGLVSIAAGISGYFTTSLAVVAAAVAFAAASLAAYSWYDSSGMFYRRLSQAVTLLPETPPEVAK